MQGLRIDNQQRVAQPASPMLPRLATVLKEPVVPFDRIQSVRCAEGRDAGQGYRCG